MITHTYHSENMHKKTRLETVFNILHAILYYATLNKF